jgi:hypothetical protein
MFFQLWQRLDGLIKPTAPDLIVAKSDLPDPRVQTSSAIPAIYDVPAACQRVKPAAG